MKLGYDAARRVLEDIKWLREKLENETGYTEWRLHWVSCVVLLRTVGHVAEKVDGKAENKLLLGSREVFETWKEGDEHLIFREFINKERNSILKEYETGMSEGPIPVVAQAIGLDGTPQDFGCLIEENIYRPISGGYYDGEDGRTLIDEALIWWAQQINRMEEIANN